MRAFDGCQNWWPWVTWNDPVAVISLRVISHNTAVLGAMRRILWNYPYCQWGTTHAMSSVAELYVRYNIIENYEMRTVLYKAMHQYMLYSKTPDNGLDRPSFSSCAFSRPSISAIVDDSMAVWLSGSTLVSINEVTLRRARLVGLLGWMTGPGFNSRCWKPIAVYNQSSRSTQPGHPSMGRRNWVVAKGLWFCASGE